MLSAQSPPICKTVVNVDLIVTSLFEEKYLTIMTLGRNRVLNLAIPRILKEAMGKSGSIE